MGWVVGVDIGVMLGDVFFLNRWYWLVFLFFCVGLVELCGVFCDVEGVVVVLSWV